MIIQIYIWNSNDGLIFEMVWAKVFVILDIIPYVQTTFISDQVKGHILTLGGEILS